MTPIKARSRSPTTLDLLVISRSSRACSVIRTAELVGSGSIYPSASFRSLLAGHDSSDGVGLALVQAKGALVAPSPRDNYCVVHTFTVFTAFSASVRVL
jgi:hypothetical protein